MDKKILSAAIIAVMAAPVAAVADVTLYGQVHLSAGAVDHSYDDSTTDTLLGEDNMQVRSHNSRLGVKGSEDLGGGLKANFMLEYGVNPDDNTDAGWTRRNQWLGLSGDSWGEFRAGRHDTPLKMAQGSFDQFNDTDADIGTISLGEERVDNVLAYLTPSFNGLSGAAAIVSGEATKCDEAGNDGIGADCALLAPGTPSSDKTGIADIYSLAGMYSNGPFFASLAYNDYDASQNSGNMDTLWRGVATYQIGDFQVGGLYEGGEAECNSCDTEAWGLSGKYTFGNVDLKGQYMEGSYEMGPGVSDDEADQWSLGADYNFSKRTTAYFMYTAYENDAPGANAPGADGDQDYDFAGVGMIHKF